MEKEKEKSTFSFKKLAAPETIKATAVQAVGNVGGAITAYGINKLVNPKQSFIGPLVMLGVGALGMHYFNTVPPKNTLTKLLQGATEGTTVFGGLKSLEYMFSSPAPAGTGGLLGFIPPEIMDKLKRYIPTINGMGEMSQPSGYYNDPMSSMMGLNAYYDTYSSNQNQYYATPINGVVEGEFQVAEVL